MDRSSTLFLFVEGNDDERFFEKIILPLLKKRYFHIKIIKHGKRKKNKINSYFGTCVKNKLYDCLFIVDMNHSSCFTKRKEKEMKKFSNLDKKYIFIVVKEIESWYLAGLDHKASNNLKIKYFHHTNNIDKEKFNSIIPKHYESRSRFMKEILENFSIEIAMQKNDSFRYFITKLNLLSN